MAWDSSYIDVRSLSISMQPSMGQVLRSLKRQEQGLFNCVASIIDDSTFVQQMAEHWQLPLFANLRCGLWYVRGPRLTCYFKSTDGHSGNWSFSTTRLNLHVAEAAAARGGALLVDATRRGKKLPDALAKTVPLWAAVLNRAVQRLRWRQGTGGGYVSWDTDVHLPPWVSGNERHQIRLRLDAWADSLEEVGADLSQLAATLRKPLRCMWVNQESRFWGEGGAEPAALDFTPLVLVSASKSNGRGRATLTLPAELSPGPGGSGCRAAAGAAVAEAEAEAEAAGTEPRRRKKKGRDISLKLRQQEPGPRLVHHCATSSSQEEDASPEEETSSSSSDGVEGQADAGLLVLPYDYVPGAGDDEESWAQGLTPSLMWANVRALLAAGPYGIEGAVQALLQRHEESAPPGRLPQMSRLQLQQGPRQQPQRPQRQRQWPEEDGFMEGLGIDQARSCASPASHPAHRLAPQGCVSAGETTDVGSGIYLLGESGLALGDLASGAAPKVWQHVGAVLNVGQHQHPSMLAEPASPTCPAAAGREDGSAGGRSQRGSAPLDLAGLPTRYLWLPVARPWEDKRGLLCALHPALRFASHHLAAGRRVLLHCDGGNDASVCAALAVFLACFSLDPSTEGRGEGAGSGGGGFRATRSQSYASLPGGSGAPALAAPGIFTRLRLRQHLAAISAVYPLARPSQGLLRQTFNWLLAGPEAQWKHAREG